MYTQCFLAESFALPAVPCAHFPGTTSEKETVRLHIVGSLRGIASITHTLHVLGFAEVNAWSQPQSTGNPGEYVTVLIRQVMFP
ncbi:MAG: peptide ABC transporter substrate-binding protein [Cyanobacteria bacterium J06639_14]